MSTGISPKEKQKKKIPYSISFAGKETAESILSCNSKKLVDFGSNDLDSENLLIYDDNKNALLNLLHTTYKGKVKLVYIDPPFSSSSNFVSKNQNLAYKDTLGGGEYLEFLRERLVLIKEMLSNDGSIYLHLDGNMAFPMKIIMDELFGSSNCRSFITRKKCSTKNYTKNSFGNISDYILFYSKSSQYIWNRPCSKWEDEKIKEQYPYVDNATGKRYKKVPIHAPGIRNGETGKEWMGKLPPEGKHWQYTPSKLDELNAAGEIYWSPNGNPRRKVFFNENKGVPIQDIWLDYRDSVNQSILTTGYPTEKNYEMLKMIISASSNKGDIVMDCFAGSGTTLGAATELSRVWIGIDNSLESMKAILQRLNGQLDYYGDYVKKKNYQTKMNLPVTPYRWLTSDDKKDELEEVFDPINRTEKSSFQNE